MNLYIVNGSDEDFCRTVAVIRAESEDKAREFLRDWFPDLDPSYVIEKLDEGQGVIGYTKNCE